MTKKLKLLMGCFVLCLLLCGCTQVPNVPVQTQRPGDEQTVSVEKPVTSTTQPEEYDDKTILANGYEDIVFTNEFDISNDGAYENNPKYLMAHNIYSDPDLSGTSGYYQGFMIDFKADYRGSATYWALCNFGMDLSDLRSKYNNVSGGGAYCGLQKNEGTRTSAIMSFWQVEYDGKIQNAMLIYPVKNGNGSFDNEGSGANYIPEYAWEAGKWYRMFICCYDDSETNHTIVEMWIMDIDANKWDKICAYDTKLTNSCFIGAMSQFMENYGFEHSTDVRSFQYANIYVQEYGESDWRRIDRSTLSIDTWYGNKKGTFAMGSTSTNLWGITCGYGSDAAKPNEDIHTVETIDGTENYKFSTPY